MEKDPNNNNSNSWRTPPEIYDPLNKIYNFQLDPATTEDNPLNTPHFFTEKEDGLNRSWKKYKSIFLNPPYGHAKLANGKKGIYLLELWIKKAYLEFHLNGKKQTIVMLLPATVSTKWFHSYVWNSTENKPQPHTQIIFPNKRIRYLDYTGTKRESPRFDSMIVIFKKES